MPHRRPSDEDFHVQFLKDVATHKLTVIREDGLHRHLRFARPGTFCMHFDLITWPGYLCYTGDMGTFVFKRLEDMLEFFRRDEGRLFRIDLRYWAEKVEAADKHDGLSEFSAEAFRGNLRDAWVDYIEHEKDSGRMTAEEAEELWKQAQEEVLFRLDDGPGEMLAMEAALEFKHGNDRPFSDFYEHDNRVWSQRFLWCCHALAWGIAQYDAAKANQRAELAA